ncbi:UNKNOWN [Stylonychia lemnae]|uniref:Uncharacterized protein n=1 Tax=Stylonychia lemnae TaxID=5949 RepID=A0A078B5S9_STYLE|nr:UNKNOWN [Stylonychia lemnae]|eukprot:CDW88662.1 UNKNOWN [Stylonychia lemnae]
MMKQQSNPIPQQNLTKKNYQTKTERNSKPLKSNASYKKKGDKILKESSSMFKNTIDFKNGQTLNSSHLFSLSSTFDRSPRQLNQDFQRGITSNHNIKKSINPLTRIESQNNSILSQSLKSSTQRLSIFSDKGTINNSKAYQQNNQNSNKRASTIIQTFSPDLNRFVQNNKFHELRIETAFDGEDSIQFHEFGQIDQNHIRLIPQSFQANKSPNESRIDIHTAVESFEDLEPSPINDIHILSQSPGLIKQNTLFEYIQELKRNEMSMNDTVLMQENAVLVNRESFSKKDAPQQNKLNQLKQKQSLVTGISFYSQSSFSDRKNRVTNQSPHPTMLSNYDKELIPIKDTEREDSKKSDSDQYVIKLIKCPISIDEEGTQKYSSMVLTSNQKVLTTRQQYLEDDVQYPMLNSSMELRLDLLRIPKLDKHTRSCGNKRSQTLTPIKQFIGSSLFKQTKSGGEQVEQFNPGETNAERKNTDNIEWREKALTYLLQLRDKDREIIGLKQENQSLRQMLNYILQSKLSP